MRVIFSKSNSERLPQYNIITKIIIDKSGKKKAIKEPVTPEANQHIQQIYKNHKTLKDQYNLNLVEPTLKENNIYFKIAEGHSLEHLLLLAIKGNDKEQIQNLLNHYFSILDSMIDEKNVKFTPTKEFCNIFGEWKIDEPQDLINIANVDMLFSNLFINDEDQITLIDYEWVFNFPIPKSFIAWRAFNIFNHFHSLTINKNCNLPNDIEIKDIFRHNNLFQQMEHNFCASVYGKGFQNSIEKKLLKHRTEPIYITNFLSKIVGSKSLFLITKCSQLLYRKIKGFF